ncbi:hypothetical protein HZS_6104 [Henneguya salminicola]|nr:hypothetical protein HZS_6104 [Henneguya salminicola]
MSENKDVESLAEKFCPGSSESESFKKVNIGSGVTVKRNDFMHQSSLVKSKSTDKQPTELEIAFMKKKQKEIDAKKAQEETPEFARIKLRSTKQ